MFELEVEMLGNIIKTEKGFIAQYLVTLPSGNRDVIKAFSKNPEKLISSGVLVCKSDFFFVG